MDLFVALCRAVKRGEHEGLILDGRLRPFFEGKRYDKCSLQCRVILLHPLCSCWLVIVADDRGSDLLESGTILNSPLNIDLSFGREHMECDAR